tara:strand:- start:401 stop:694 length:294 start_codon:yes stop_codon:yes gene_type:complete
MVVLVELHKDHQVLKVQKDQMVVVLLLKQLHPIPFIESEEVVVEEAVMTFHPHIVMVNLVEVEEDQLHTQDHQVGDKDKLHIIQVNQLIMDNLVQVI